MAFNIDVPPIIIPSGIKSLKAATSKTPAANGVPYFIKILARDLFIKSNSATDNESNPHAVAAIMTKIKSIKYLIIYI